MIDYATAIKGAVSLDIPAGTSGFYGFANPAIPAFKGCKLFPMDNGATYKFSLIPINVGKSIASVLAIGEYGNGASLRCKCYAFNSEGTMLSLVPNNKVTWPQSFGTISGWARPKGNLAGLDNQGLPITYVCEVTNLTGRAIQCAVYYG